MTAVKPLPSFDAADITRAVSMEQAIEALRTGFRDRPVHLERASHPVAGGDLLIMPAADDRTAGIKLLMVQPANALHGRPVIQGTYVLFDAVAGAPLALLDGTALTSLRTPAASAIATAVLAREDARTLGIIGSGPQAQAHVDAIRIVCPNITEVVLASRTAANAQSAIATVAASLVGTAAKARVGTYTDAADCDIVCTLTRSTEPIIDASMVRRGTHVNAVGSYRTDMRELAADLVGQSTVVVDDEQAARAEAGDLTQAVDESRWSWDRLGGDLADLCSGRVARRSPEEITVFKSVGLAFEDLVIARLVAHEMNLL